jgi:hypothetical protein
MQRKVSILILFFGMSISCFSQDFKLEIEKIKKDITNSNFKSAEEKLENLYYITSTNIEVNWLYAFTLSNLGKFNKSKKLYESTIQMLPNSNELKFEYIQTLLKMGLLSEALETIQFLKNTDFDKSQVLLTEAEIYYWSANYRKANESISKIDSIYPNNSVTRELKSKINEAQSLSISFETNYLNDNQPLESISEKLTFGKMQSYLLHPILEIKNENISNQSQIIDVCVGNEMLFTSIGLSTQFKFGVEYNNVTENKQLIGNVSLHKSLTKRSKLSFNFERLTYKSTLESTLTDLLYHKGSIALNLGDYDKSLLHVGYEINAFEDQNVISNFGAWYISRPLFNSDFKVQLGYGLGYSDSKKSTYTPIVNAYSTPTIASKYDLYYTPSNQLVNSIVLVLNYPFSPRWNFNLKGNYGFYATANSPVYVASNGSNSNIVYTENKTEFNPYDASLNLVYDFKNKWSFSIYGSYFNTYFYDSYNTGFRLNFKL